LQRTLAIKCAACKTEIDASAHACDVCGLVVPGQTAVFSSSVHTTPAALEQAALAPLEQAAAEKVAAEKAAAAAGEAGGGGAAAAASAAKVVNLASVFV
jgi:hypothetical protein